MNPAQYDLDGLYQGDTYVITGRLLRNVGTEAAPVYQPIDLTGYTGLAQVRLKPNAPSVLASFVVEFPNPVAGEYRLTLSAEESSKIFKAAVWDFQTSHDEDPVIVETWMRGAVPVDNDVSRGINA